MLRLLSAVPKITVTALIILAIVNLLVGVILRYFVGAITDWLDVDPVPFTWVEEVGELSLAWLTLIGAAIGIQSRSHFTLAVFVHRLPLTAQLWIHRFNHALIAGVGAARRMVRLQALPAQPHADDARPARSTSPGSTRPRWSAAS